MNKLNQMTASLLVAAAVLTGARTLHAADATDLGLFKKGANWTFKKNTGDGSMEVATDGDKPIGVLKFEFTKAAGKSKAYVLAQTEVNIPETAGIFQMQARSSVIKRIALRFIDDSGQVHQVKPALTGAGAWSTIKISLDKKMEHWKGANDGKIHYPIKSLLIAVADPEGETKTGKVEFADAVTLAK